MNVKQVIVMRKDLGMRKGKMVAQGAHASLGALLKCFDKEYDVSGEQTEITYSSTFTHNSILDNWLNGPFTKICVAVNSEEELLKIHKECVQRKIINALITDLGSTEFHGIPTVTCLGIGPYISEEIDKITGHLPLL